jgi:hypothetical protein
MISNEQISEFQEALRTGGTYLDFASFCNAANIPADRVDGSYSRLVWESFQAIVSRLTNFNAATLGEILRAAQRKAGE